MLHLAYAKLLYLLSHSFPEKICRSQAQISVVLARSPHSTNLQIFSSIVHYRSSSPRLPKATSTPTAGSAPGANSALTIKYQDTEQSKSRSQTTKNLRS